MTKYIKEITRSRTIHMRRRGAATELSTKFLSFVAFADIKAMDHVPCIYFLDRICESADFSLSNTKFK